MNGMLPQRHLVLGAARSGKSRYALTVAEELARKRDSTQVYVATAMAGDAEMTVRIARHRQERAPDWRTVEAPRQLAQTLATLAEDAVIVIDCLTLWLSNALLADFTEEAPNAPLPTWAAEYTGFMHYLATCRDLIIVSNEVGGGIVPALPLARRFQDEQGWLNQAVAAVCERVTLVVAGIPISIKGKGLA
jgi:adenosylcobinamide kinase/adenosylcobinamide-phosphate guanylyltransferase